jgi:hypothetical protein
MVCIHSTIILKSFIGGVGQRRHYRSIKFGFRMRIFIGIQMFTTVVFTVWLLYVWFKASNFGSQKVCNHLVKYAVFVIASRATAPWLLTNSVHRGSHYNRIRAVGQFCRHYLRLREAGAHHNYRTFSCSRIRSSHTVTYSTITRKARTGKQPWEDKVSVTVRFTRLVDVADWDNLGTGPVDVILVKDVVHLEGEVILPDIEQLMLSWNAIRGSLS